MSDPMQETVTNTLQDLADSVEKIKREERARLRKEIDSIRNPVTSRHFDAVNLFKHKVLAILEEKA